MTLVTPETIRTLQRKLYVKAKQEPGFRFYSLYDKVYRLDSLSHAYDLARSNGGAPGIDGLTFEILEAKEGKAAFLAELEAELRKQSYRVQPIRRVWIPKAHGEKRPLGIPTIRDRVVQTAMKLIIEPIFEADFCACSYGFRPQRSAHDAVDAVAEGLLRGYTEVIDADLSKYFDTIPHAKLMAVVAERIADGAILALIKQWLKAPVVEEDRDGTRRSTGGRGQRRGTPQGGVISPLLANLYLHLLDRIWERHGWTKELQARLVRYCDDFVVLCKAGTQRPTDRVRQVLERLDLTLNEDKSRIVDARQGAFHFLGFSFRQRCSRRSGKRYPHVEPSRPSVQRLKDEVKRLTDRRLTCVPLPDVVGRLNRTVRGWTNYFHHRNCTAALGHVKWYVEERVRTHLRKRHKLKNRDQGYSRFPSAYLYATIGLYKVPTTAPWCSAHA